MNELEDDLARLRPAPAPEPLRKRVFEGASARPVRHAYLKDALFLASAAGLLATITFVLTLGPDAPPAVEAPARPQEEVAREVLARLKTCRHRIVFESNRDGRWDLYVTGGEGAEVVNLTRTADVDELYPKASPDGKKICFVADEGPADARVRNLYVMNVDGTGRQKIADNAREPCWSGDSAAIAYLKGEYDKFTYSDFATKGIFIHDLKTGQTREHPNRKIHHLYTLNWSPDGKWFIATVHGGMGFKHGILAIQAEGDGVFDLGLGGCRPDLSPDGKKIAWGHGDYAVGVADLDLTSSPPKATNIRNIVESKDPMETYHADWSPDGQYVAFSYGPKVKGKNLKGLLPEFPGVDAPGWNLAVAEVSGKNRFVVLTADGKSYKEPDWIFVSEGK